MTAKDLGPTVRVEWFEVRARLHVTRVIDHHAIVAACFKGHPLTQGAWTHTARTETLMVWCPTDAEVREIEGCLRATELFETIKVCGHSSDDLPPGHRPPAFQSRSQA